MGSGGQHIARVCLPASPSQDSAYWARVGQCSLDV